jgi:hypothetical protein
MSREHSDIAQLLKGILSETLQPSARRAYQYVKTRYDEHFYERPSAAYRAKLGAASSIPDFQDIADRLCRDGLVILPNYFDAVNLAEMREEFERLIALTPPNEESIRTNSAHISTGRLAQSRVFSDLAFEPELLRLTQYYWGKPVVLNGTGGTRIEPFASDDYGSYQWHHDGKRKQVRVFILLTDVPVSGQRTEVVAGSNHLWYEDLTTSRLSREQALAAGSIVDCAGPAGSVVIFDTNAMHRGNRNAGPRRDTWNFAYRAPNAMTTKLAKRPPLHPDTIVNLTAEQRIIARLAEQETR